MIACGQPGMSKGGRGFGPGLRIGAPGGRHRGRDVCGQRIGARFEDGQALLQPAGR